MACGHNKTARKKRTRRILVTLIVILTVITLLAVSGIVAYNRMHLTFRDVTIRRDSVEVDLRDMDVSCEEYRELKAELPETHILWNIPIGDQYYDCTAEKIVIDRLDPEDIPLFGLFDRLTEVDAANADCYDALQALSGAMPGCTIHWAVHLGDSAYSPSETTLDLTSNAVESGEILSELAQFDALQQVILTDAAYSAEEQRELMKAYPKVSFLWNVDAAGKTWRNTETHLSYAGQRVDIAALTAAADLFCGVEELDMSGCGCTTQELLDLQDAFRGAAIRSELQLFGQDFNTDTETLDFSGIPMTDTAELERILPLMPKLKKVDMCDCGISNEEMDALNKRHKNVQFVWRVTFSVYSLRTDATFFCASDLPSNDYIAIRMDDKTLEPLKYCTELVALDLGHMVYTDLSFLENMPKLKYLILVDARFSDISPIGTLKELVYLEIFNNTIDDLSPLLECKELKHLNIGYTRGFDASVLKNMTQLERLWFPGHGQSRELIDEIQAALPNTQCHMPVGDPDFSTGNGWRDAEVYYQMRDIFSMHYMPGGTGLDE